MSVRKRRRRGDATGAEDGEVWPAMVRRGATNRGGVAQGTARRAWGCGTPERRMGRGTCLAKRRGRGGGTGAENGDTWAERVRSNAVDRGAVEYTKAAWTWRLGVWRGQGAALRLDGEGVIEFFHPGLQILDLALLLFQEEVFDPVQP